MRLAFHDSPGWLPPVDIEETDDAVVVRASVPGFSPDQIQITTADGDLIIQGAHEDGSKTEPTEDSRYHVRERRGGRFYRRVPLPVRTATAGAGARYENGVSDRARPQGRGGQGRHHRYRVRVGPGGRRGRAWCTARPRPLSDRCVNE